MPSAADTNDDLTVQVVDASVVVAVLTDAGDDGRWAAQRVVEAPLAAPHLMPFEVANVLRRLVRGRLLDAGGAADALDALRALDVSLVPFAPLGERIWHWRDALTNYDASYVALAERLGCRLVTLDRRMARAPGIDMAVVVAP